jgi:hypothetical protein
MIDTFRVSVHVPSTSSLFRDGYMVLTTPTGSVEFEKLPPKAWRDMDNEVTIRDFVEARLINMFPARRTKWHGSRCTFYHEGDGIVATFEVDSDHFDGAPDLTTSRV